ncbi:D-serine dehydratase [Diutina catenulata]
MFPYQLTPLADKHALLKAYMGRTLDEVPTPGFVVDRGRFQRNSNRMLANSQKLGAEFRAHVKTHKSTEATRLQLGTGNLATDKVVVSTLMEAWNLLPLVGEGLINDILFSLPGVTSRLSELAALAEKIPQLRIMLDNPAQVEELAAYNHRTGHMKKWSLFIKINMGTNGAGLINDTELLTDTIRRAANHPESICVYGFYCHAGHSYSSNSEETAKSFLLEEIKQANLAAKQALRIDASLAPLQISVGATPTAHASEILTREELEKEIGQLFGTLELHAGNYPFCDLQQVSTGCVTLRDVSCRVLADVCSTYPGRGSKSPGEQLINAGVIALAREFGPLPGHGRVVEPEDYQNWIVGRLSQEHGILTPLEDKPTMFIPHGTRVAIVPQHSCITAASYPWYYVVDGNNTIVDIWVPWRGW